MFDPLLCYDCEAQLSHFVFMLIESGFRLDSVNELVFNIICFGEGVVVGVSEDKNERCLDDWRH